jgi:hypothetical protein
VDCGGRALNAPSGGASACPSRWACPDLPEHHHAEDKRRDADDEQGELGEQRGALEYLALTLRMTVRRATG